MLSLETWIIFLSASLALAFAPGPGMLYVLSRTIAGGRKAGMLSTCGTAIGGTVHVIGAAVGVSALLAASQVAFVILKLAGGIFLVYLGLKMILSKHYIEAPTTQSSDVSAPTSTSILLQGMATEVLNPKTAIFFLAFIPQFVQLQNGSVFAQFIVLGLIVVVLNTVPDFLIASFAKPLESLWRSSLRIRKAQQTVGGLFLIGLGIFTLTSGSYKPLNGEAASGVH
ncbi:MAG: LysE family translocator [Pseudomonadales bacterium]|nr:LysE family translocator [Pseudomonadales bacterium]